MQLAFIKDISTPGGVTLSYHRLTDVRVSGSAFDSVMLNIASWASEAKYLEGIPASWNTPVIRALPEAFTAAFSDLVTGSTEFASATPVSDANESMDGAKVRKWGAVKAQRDLHEYGEFPFDSKTFDGDADSQRRIIGAVVLSMMPQLAWLKICVELISDVTLPPFPEFDLPWTCADNTIDTLDILKVSELGQAVSLQVGAAHTTARVLRADIDSATTQEQLDAIPNWPQS